MADVVIGVETGTLERAVAVHQRIPEFEPEPPHTLEDFKEKIGGAKSLVTIGTVDGADAGYSVGYDKFNDGSYYLWMAGVAPEYRHHKLFLEMLKAQEGWARENGYTSLKIKTRNNRIGMRISLAKAGYNLVELELHDNPLDTRLLHQKEL